MSLIDEVAKLRELEQATREDTEISSPIDDSDYLERLVDVAPAMLAALSTIQEGDAKDLSWVAEFFEADCEPEGDRIAAVIRRYEHMAASMEKEEQG